jgi:hypothetical protein
MDLNKSFLSSVSTRAAAIAALVLAVSSPALAQNAQAPDTATMPPAREGNTYDHRDHQPTQAEIDNAEAADGSSIVPQENKSQIEKEAEDAIEADKKSIEEYEKQSNDGQ